MADTEGVDSPRRRPLKVKQPQAQQSPRLRMACLRCQRRKIRCDGELPVCKNCRVAGAACTDGESARLRGLPRAYIATLKERVSWLESIVRSRCPDIDLSRGPVAEETDPGGTDPVNDAASGVEESLASPSTMIDSQSSTVETMIPRIHEAPRPNAGPSASGTNALSHEIGLVSLGTNQEPRYIGPSSGYFLARLMLSKPPRGQYDMGQDAPFPQNLVEAIQGPLPLPPRQTARQLCDAYFEFIHPQYPVLHQPTFLKGLDQAYAQETPMLYQRPDPLVSFQVYMVLAIGATVLSGRVKAQMPAESYCLSAFQYFERLNVTNSLQGVQCLILMLIFSIHNPHLRINVWYLNYQCIAALVDLGLQRDINTDSGIAVIEQEMRTRIFWVIFMLDRTIATMMGRPIGLRDEACELRLPQGFDDSVLTSIGPGDLVHHNEVFDSMAYSIQLFRLAKLNSEIKYVANSIVREAPRYAYPTIIDIHKWQDDMLQQLDQWASNIPVGYNNAAVHMDFICRLRYHSLRMLLLRPSPAIPRPSTQALEKCYHSSQETIRIFDQMYKKNLLTHSWMTFHTLVLSTLTMLYCIKVAPSIANRTELDVLMGDLSTGLSILSATGEHWSGAKRSRDILDELGRSIIRWLRESNGDGGTARNPTNQATQQVGTTSSLDLGDTLGPSGEATFPGQAPSGVTMNPFDDLMGDSFAGYFETTESINVDNIVRDLFQDFIPIYRAST